VACLLLSLAACTSGEDEIMSEKIQDGAYIATDNKVKTLKPFILE
jgi:predicted nucleic acid-binding protein